MSDSDDEFDREAERERLREKYEQDKQRREATERMSDLLLKGATMTNRHCGTCGSPIFQHEGQAFCPTCQEPVGEGDQQEGGRQAQAQDQQAGQGSQQAAAGSEPAAADTDEPAAGSPVDGEPDGDVRPTEADAPERTRGASGIPSASGESSARAGASDATPRGGPSGSRAEAPGAPAGKGDLGSARASLTRTLSELARQAEATDDLGRKRDYLATAKEAAETLRAVRQAER